MRLRREDGFTLIELAIAVGLFGVVMVGMSLVFRNAFRTAGESRAAQQAKTVAQERLEEIRSLPFYISQREEAADVDMLDRYFPDDQNVNPTATGGVGEYFPNGVDGDASTTGDNFAFRSTRTVTKAQTPPLTERVLVQFVQPQVNGTLLTRPPISSYNSNVADFDSPGANAAKVTVTVSYTLRGRARTTSVDTVISRIQLEAPKAEASGTASALTITDVAFQDGDIDGTLASITTRVADVSSQFREVTASTSQTQADPVDISELNPATSVAIQGPMPGGGQTTASVPNTTTGNTQTGTAFLSEGSMNTLGTPSAQIARWCFGDGADCQSTSAARVSTTHSAAQNPEGMTSAHAHNIRVNARDFAEITPHRMADIFEATSSLEQRSTQREVSLTGSVDIRDLAIWGSTSFLSNPRYRGVVLIERVRVSVSAEAEAEGAMVDADTDISWEIRNLRIWDPNLFANGTFGHYGTSYSFGFVSGCGQWATPDDDGPEDCHAPLENPNPVVIPAAYAGVDPTSNQPATSLAISAGSTTDETYEDAGAGSATASAGQKNVLTITTRDDITGAAALEPSLTAMGSVNLTVSYLDHEHT